VWAPVPNCIGVLRFVLRKKCTAVWLSANNTKVQPQTLRPLHPHLCFTHTLADNIAFTEAVSSQYVTDRFSTFSNTTICLLGIGVALM